jgi:hypothetical protein
VRFTARVPKTMSGQWQSTHQSHLKQTWHHVRTESPLVNVRVHKMQRTSNASIVACISLLCQKV